MSEQTLAIAIPDRRRAEQGWVVPAWLLTNEALAWAAIGAGTLVSHLTRLGEPPLNMDEGRRAMEAWDLFRDGRVAYEGGPILTNLTSGVFALFNDGEIQARLVPALCGVALVLLPLLLRPVLGAWWAVLAGVALAFSTTLLTGSRSVSPAVPVVLCLAIMALAGWRFGIEHSARWLIALCVAAFVGIGIDTAFVVGLGAIVLAYAIAEGEIFGRAHWWEPVGKHGRQAILIALGVAVLLDTRLLMNPGGIQAGLFDPLWRWTGEVARGAGLTAPIVVALMDGPIVLLALVGLCDYKRNPRPIRFLGTWLLVSLTLVSLMRMPDLRYLAQPVLPAALLAGFGLQRLIGWQREAGSSRTLILGMLALVPVVTASFQVNAGLRQNLSPWGAAAVVLVAGLLLVSLLSFNLLRGPELGAALSTWLLVLVTLGLVAGGSRALEARGTARGQLVDATVITPEMEYVREMALKWYRASPDTPLLVDPTLRPLVAWTLRDIPTVRYDPNATSQPQPRLLSDPPAVTQPDTLTLRTMVGYTADWPSLSLQASRVWRWMVNRESLVTLRPYAIVVVQPAGR